MSVARYFRNKRNGISTCLLATGLLTGINAQDLSSRYAESITPAELRKHLEIIAADSLEGRFTGSPGQKKAAAYMVSNFQQYGLTPAAQKADGQKSFLQEYELYRRDWGEVAIKTGKKTYELYKDLVVNGLTNVPEALSIGTVFAGYGIEAGSYNDYKDLDVKGKAVVVFEGEPFDKSGNSLISGTKEKTKWSSPQGWQAKATLALGKGAGYLIVISEKEGGEFEKEIQRRASMRQRVSQLTLRKVEESLTNVAAFTVSKDAAADMLGTKSKTLEKLRRKITNTARPVSAGPEGTVVLTAVRKHEVVATENVAAFLEGTDKKDEVIVISAHLDHIGISPDGQINNGADDDGSGTVALLELAQAFSMAKAGGHGPRRSLLFLNVTGEELGLFGSEYYSENPLFPLEKTVANLNIDMIGRVDEAHTENPRYVYLIGSDKLSSELHAIGEEVNKKYVQLDLDYTFNDANDPNRFYYRSDHYNFAKKGIPVVFYFTGVHPDYHRPGDEVHKILFDRQSEIVKLIFHTAWELANRENRIRVDSNKP